jgi:hypothetical protein
VGLARRAAAAAADEREGDWVSRRMKAEAAAVAALGLAVSLVRGCKNITTTLVSRSSPVRRLKMLGRNGQRGGAGETRAAVITA